ncbi:hypothetical protein WKK05_36015 (plasmid) [Nostoc sp. UHCC 0302]|uniref:hypothetical protein n=1 Tax=Nostoc sp. UHCC 0302 TaxID=3134896 RepID=UPI00311C9510
MMTQISVSAPTKDPLTTQDRQIIATIVNESDYSHECKPEDVVTIWINEDDIVWVKMTHGYARYHKEPFKRAVAEIKISLSAPVERNQQLDDELEQASQKISLLGEYDWLSLNVKFFTDKVIGNAGCYIEHSLLQAFSPLSDWDFSPPVYVCLPAAICPDCDGHGCANCSYRGTRSEDLCKPVDDYRLTYVGKTDMRTAHNLYKGREFIGILFRVRNSECFWLNDPETYYWQCGDGIQYWSVREAVEALSRVTTVVVSGVSRELVAV